MGNKVVLVGVDGSNESLKAATWGARFAERAGWDLKVLCAYALPSFTASSLDGGYAALDDEAIKNSALAVVNEAVQQISAPGMHVETVLEAGDPAGILVEYSKKVDLIVVGTRGGGGFADRLLGTVSSALPAHAHCPVVVVPRTKKDVTFVPPKRIVVGVDGSNTSTRSLSVAISVAEMWDAELTVFSAVPLATTTGAMSWFPSSVDRDAVMNDVRERLNELVAEAVKDHQVRVRKHALDGNPASLLTEFSSAVELVVVGSRGRGGFTGLLLGSTSQAVLGHAYCPVLVVPSKHSQSGDVIPVWDRN
ncbi:MAG: universal stress protein [Actinomycetaceae bacterium]|nr:universal stress protein [Actinomycetaceae bacterium]